MVSSHADFYRGVERATSALAGTIATDPAARAAAVHTAMANLLDETEGRAPRACRRGCDPCCHLPVGVTFGEALRLATAVAALPALRPRVLAEAERTHTMGWRQLVGRPCPMLHEAACTVHPERPLPCRALASADAAACARGLACAGPVPIDDAAFFRGLGAASVLAKATEAPGTRELRSALRAVLLAPDLPAAAAAFTAAMPACEDPA